MEEALDAAATVIKYLGEAVIKSCDELSALVEGVEQAADAAGVQHADLSRLGGELKQANERERMAAVVKLGEASAALERVACAPLAALYDSAASLARECLDFREAHQSLENLRRAKTQQAQNRAGRPPGSVWAWLCIWRRVGNQRGVRETLLTDVEKGCQSKELDSFDATLNLLLKEGRLLKERSAKLVNQAHDVTRTADAAGVHCAELLEVIEQADKAHTLSSIIDLEAAATAMEVIISTLPNILRDRATELGHECVELKQAYDAMMMVQQAAAEQRAA